MACDGGMPLTAWSSSSASIDYRSNDIRERTDNARRPCMSSSGTKRTNSLGRAATDCFACQKGRDSLRGLCDRQRPRCNVCTNAGKICSGYLQEIQWQGGAHRAVWKTKTQNDDSAKQEVNIPSTRRRRLSKPSTSGSGARSVAGDLQFKFIQENVQADYIDKSFADAKDGSRQEGSFGVAGQQEGQEMTNMPLPRSREQYYRTRSNSDIPLAQPRNIPILPRVRLKPPYQIDTTTGFSSVWRGSGPTMSGSLENVSRMPHFDSDSNMTMYGQTESMLAIDPRGQRTERPRSHRAVTGPQLTTDASSARMLGMPGQFESARTGAPGLYSEPSEMSRSRQSWHEIVGTRASPPEENTGRSASKKSNKTRGKPSD